MILNVRPGLWILGSRAQCAHGTRSAAILYYISCKKCDLLYIVIKFCFYFKLFLLYKVIFKLIKKIFLMIYIFP